MKILSLGKEEKKRRLMKKMECGEWIGGFEIKEKKEG